MTKNSKIGQGLIRAHAVGYKVVGEGVVSPGGKILVLKLIDGYPAFSMKNLGTRRCCNIKVHFLVGLVNFGDSVFTPGVQLRHRDGVRSNFHPDNILLGSPSENSMDRSPEARLSHAKKAATALRVLPDNLVESLKSDRREGLSWNKLAAKYRVGKSTARAIFNREYVTTFTQ